MSPTGADPAASRVLLTGATGYIGGGGLARAAGNLAGPPPGPGGASGTA